MNAYSEFVNVYVKGVKAGDSLDVVAQPNTRAPLGHPQLARDSLLSLEKAAEQQCGLRGDARPFRRPLFRSGDRPAKWRDDGISSLAQRHVSHSRRASKTIAAHSSRGASQARSERTFIAPAHQRSPSVSRIRKGPSKRSPVRGSARHNCMRASSKLDCLTSAAVLAFRHDASASQQRARDRRGAGHDGILLTALAAIRTCGACSRRVREAVSDHPLRPGRQWRFRRGRLRQRQVQ